MARQIAGPVVLVVIGVIVLVLFGDHVAGEAIAIAMIGIACVGALSLTFLAVGRSEDAERRRSAREDDAAEPPAPAEHGQDEHERPALKRRRPLPPRRPS